MAHERRDTPLHEADLAADPLAQLQHWLAEAADAGLIEPTAMTLATATTDGRPAARMVLFKGVHDGGLTFYTNYDSRKGEDLAANPRAALVFWWDKLERSVRAEGRVEKLPATMSAHYFHSRLRISQLSAAVSRQSRAVSDRAALERRYAELEKELGSAEVPLPASWGGYLVRPERFEFWQGRRGRLHDRLVYLPAGRGWRLERLEP
jgi:pyridoxamine 5'-phosphate oxidase